MMAKCMKAFCFGVGSSLQHPQDLHIVPASHPNPGHLPVVLPEACPHQHDSGTLVPLHLQQTLHGRQGIWRSAEWVVRP